MKLFMNINDFILYLVRSYNEMKMIEYLNLYVL